MTKPTVIHEGRGVVPRQLAGSVFAGIDIRAATDALPAGTEFKQATSTGYKLLHIKGSQLVARQLVLLAYAYSKALDTNSRFVQIDVDEFARQTGRCTGAVVAPDTRAAIYADLRTLATTEIRAAERTGPSRRDGRTIVAGGFFAAVATPADSRTPAIQRYHVVEIAETWLNFFQSDEVGPVYLRFAVLAQLSKNPLAQWLYMQAAQVASRTFSIDKVIELADLNDGSGATSAAAARTRKQESRAKVKAAVAALRNALAEVYMPLMPQGLHDFTKYVHCEIEDKAFRLPELHQLDIAASALRAKAAQAKQLAGGKPRGPRVLTAAGEQHKAQYHAAMAEECKLRADDKFAEEIRRAEQQQQ